MQPIRILYEDAPEAIPIPIELRHRKIEVIVWPLDAEDAIPEVPLATGHRLRSPPAKLAGKVRELGDVMSTVPASDWGIDA